MASISAKTMSEFAQDVERAFAENNDLQWTIGDLVNYGEQHFPNDYLTPFDTPTGYSLGTLNNRARTCKRFPTKHSRRFQVSFSCYQDVSSIKDDSLVENLLSRCEQEGWNRDMFRDELRIAKGLPEKKEPVKLKGKLSDVIIQLHDYFADDTIIDLTAKLAEMTELEAIAS